MKKKDHWWNGLLIIVTAAAVGAGLMYAAFGYWFKLPDGEIIVSRNWLWLVVGASYTAGWFVTRAVEGCFELIFSKEPFSRTGDDVPKEQQKYPTWLTSMFWAMGYPLFFLLVLISFSGFLILGAFIRWLMLTVEG